MKRKAGAPETIEQKAAAAAAAANAQVRAFAVPVRRKQRPVGRAPQFDSIAEYEARLAELERAREAALAAAAPAVDSLGVLWDADYELELFKRTATSAAVEATPLVVDLVPHIAGFTDLLDVLAMASVCKEWRSTLLDRVGVGYVLRAWAARWGVDLVNAFKALDMEQDVRGRLRALTFAASRVYLVAGHRMCGLDVVAAPQNWQNRKNVECALPASVYQVLPDDGVLRYTETALSKGQFCATTRAYVEQRIETDTRAFLLERLPDVPPGVPDGRREYELTDVTLGAAPMRLLLPKGYIGSIGVANWGEVLALVADRTLVTVDYRTPAAPVVRTVDGPFGAASCLPVFISEDRVAVCTLPRDMIVFGEERWSIMNVRTGVLWEATTADVMGDVTVKCNPHSESLLIG
ncbi:MAG TPA: hypothetical protein VKD22_01940, partial [Ramlibacter sp.]|nr:hypothetical protein [Ramlibacter sp.]